MITRFNKQVCRQLTEDVLGYVETALNKKGILVERGGGTFNDWEYTMKLKLSVPIPKPVIEENTKALSFDDIVCGMAKSGAQLFHSGKQVTIHGARRTKYIFSYNDKPEKKYIANFISFTLINPFQKG